MESASRNQPHPAITVSLIESTLADHRPVKRPTGDLVPASVLILVRDGQSGAEVLLTQRSNNVKSHKGQVSLPGGMSEKEDRDSLATAIRESVEEVGLDPGDLRVLGRLDDYKTITGFHVVPYVAALDTFEDLAPMTEEITAVFSFPLSHMADPANVRRMPVQHPDGFDEILFMDYAGYVIWGATARMLNGLMELIR